MLNLQSNIFQTFHQTTDFKADFRPAEPYHIPTLKM